MTPTQRQAMEMALKWLESGDFVYPTEIADNLRAALAEQADNKADADDEPVDDYGNPLSGDRLINCCFPDCGCNGARLCMAESGPSRAACALNIEFGSWTPRSKT